MEQGWALDGSRALRSLPQAEGGPARERVRGSP